MSSISQTSSRQLASITLGTIAVVNSCSANFEKLGLSVSSLWELQQAPNRLLIGCKKNLFCLTTQLAPAKLSSLLQIAVQMREKGYILSYPGPCQNDQERKLSNRVSGQHKRTKIEAYISRKIIRNRGCCSNSIYLQAHPSVNCTVFYISLHSKQYIQFTSAR